MKWNFRLMPGKASLSPLRAFDAKSMLRAAEESAESVYVGVRLIVFLSLVALFFAMEAVHDHNDVAVISLALYGGLTAISLIAAWKRISRPWVPYAFATCDIGLIAIHLMEMARDIGLSPSMMFSIPASGLLFVVLTHAALHFRPALVVYTACVSLLFIVFGRLLLPTMSSAPTPSFLGSDEGGLMAMVYWKGLPVAIVALMSFMLWLISLTMSRLLDQAISHAGRSVRLSRFFSPNLVDRLSSDRDGSPLMGRRCMATILFIDIRGFTAMSEKMVPEEIVAMLTEFRSVVTEQIFAHDGTVDKFIGDSVMAVFGTPESRTDDSHRAVRCGMAILEAVRKWGKARITLGNSPVSIGIGAHYGEVFAGTIGSERLMEFTVLGDTVNVAARLEKVCSETGGLFVISESLFQVSDGGLDPVAWERLAPFHLPGRAQDVVAYSLRGTVHPHVEPQRLKDD